MHILQVLVRVIDLSTGLPPSDNVLMAGAPE